MDGERERERERERRRERERERQMTQQWPKTSNKDQQASGDSPNIQTREARESKRERGARELHTNNANDAKHSPDKGAAKRAAQTQGETQPTKNHQKQRKSREKGRRGGGGNTASRKTKPQNKTGGIQTRGTAGAETAHDKQARTLHTSYEPSRSPLDRSLKEAIEGEVLSF